MATNNKHHMESQELIDIKRFLYDTIYPYHKDLLIKYLEEEIVKSVKGLNISTSRFISNTVQFDLYNPSNRQFSIIEFYPPIMIALRRFFNEQDIYTSIPGVYITQILQFLNDLFYCTYSSGCLYIHL